MQDWFDSNDSPRIPDPGRPIPPMPLPSIFDLARHAEAARLRAEQLGSCRERLGGHDIADLVLFEREEALRSLLLAFKPTNLSDVATQLYAGFLIADDVVIRDKGPQETQRFAALRRVFLSTLPLVAETAGFDLAEIGGGYIAGYADLEFPAEA